MLAIPSIFRSSSPAHFLKKYVSLLREVRGAEFVKSWAEGWGVRSRISFKLYLDGKRALSASQKSQLAKTLDFSSKEAQAFDSSTSQSASRDYHYASENFFETPLNTLVLNLCGIQERMTEEKIVHTFAGVFSPEEIDRSLKLLIHHGLIRSEKNAYTRIFHGAISSVPGLKSEASQKYFKKTFEMAEKAWFLPLHERELSAFTIRLSAKNVPEMKALARKFRDDLTHLTEDGQEPDSVYQCSLAAFPIYLP